MRYNILFPISVIRNIAIIIDDLEKMPVQISKPKLFDKISFHMRYDIFIHDFHDRTNIVIVINDWKRCRYHDRTYVRVDCSEA